MKTIRTICIVLIYGTVLSSSIIRAEKVNYRFQYYTTEEGLSQDNVDCILKDSRGFLWFGTWNGLNRFDAYSFTIYKSDPETPGSISDNFIYDLLEDRYGNIWVATGNGLNVYLHEQDKFISYHLRHDGESVISSNKVNVLCFDSEGVLWVGTDRGLDKIKVTGRSGEVEPLEHISAEDPESTLEDNFVNVIYLDRENRIWVGTDGGLNLFREDQGISVSYVNQPENEYSLSNNQVLSIYQDDGGILWVGTNFGLNRMPPGSTSFIRNFYDPEDPNSLAHGSVQSISQDIRGKLIVGTLGGISLYDSEQDHFDNYTHTSHSLKELNNEFVNYIFPDPQGNVWIGTDRGGVNKYNIFQTTFEYYEYIPGEVNSLSHNTINSIWEDRSGLWVGTAGGGLNYIRRSDGLYVHYRFNVSDPNSLTNDFITCILKDKSGNLWISTWGSGINILTPGNRKTGKFIHHLNEPGNDNSLVDNFVSSMVEDWEGNIWIGTFGGLTRYDPATDKFHRVLDTAAGRTILKVGCLHIDRNDNLWIGTEDGLFKKSYDRTSYYAHIDTNPKSLSGNYVISIQEDHQGNLWFGTYGNGLNKISEDDARTDHPEFVHYTERNGLANNTIYGILEDDERSLWLSTDNGLSRFYPATSTFQNFYVSDGLPSNQFYWSASFKNAWGKLYFGGMNGLLAFYPEQISNRPFHPNLVFTDFKIYNRSVKTGEQFRDKVILQKSIWHTDSIVLSYRVNEFFLEFSSLYFDQPEKVQYAYMLEGFENEWRYVVSKRRFISYTNLRGGEYTLKVKAALGEGNWAPDPLLLHIRVIPPFWVKPWFIVMAVLTLILSLISYNRYRIYALKQHKRKLEAMVRERTAQIEGQKQQLEQQNLKILEHHNKLFELNKEVQKSNQQQMRFFTHMSHEFRTPLTLIISPIEQMIRESKKSSPYYHRLLLIKRNAQRLLHLINQLMEVRRIKTGNVELKATRDDIILFLENIAQSFNGLANQKNISYSFNANHAQIRTYFDRDKIESIFYNLLSNAFKYTPAGGLVDIDVRLDEDFVEPAEDLCVISRKHYKQLKVERYVYITVTDTGCGIDKDHLKDIFKRFFRMGIAADHDIQGTGIGLYLTKELIKIHRGLLYVNSEPGKGSAFRVLIPYGKSYLSEEEIREADKLEKEIVPKLHIDLLTEQIIQDSMPPVPPEMNHEFLYNPHKPLLVLIDDDRDLCYFISNYLSSSFRVITSSNGDEGLEKVRRFMPDIVISDIMMPGMNGLEFCTLLKSDLLTSHIPVILLTSRAEVEDYIEGLESGAVDYISKPFDIKILEVKIKSLIENSQRLKKLIASSDVKDLHSIARLKVEDPFLQDAIQIIEDNLMDPKFGVQQLAEELCVSRSLLYKKLTATIDQSANDFINSIRIKKAALLLLDGNQRVSEVAYQVGFNDPKYFSKSFKKYFGMSPTEYIDSRILPS